MSSSAAARRLERARGFLDGLQSFGLVVLLVGLPLSEALKSIGLALAVLGFAGKLVCGTRPHLAGRAVIAALLAYVMAAALSIVAAEPGLRRPDELFTLAMTVVPFVLVADACRHRTRQYLFALAVVVGAAIASLGGYVDFMLGDGHRLALGSIENAVPAAEYLGACLALAAAMLIAEGGSVLTGPLLGFGSGAVAIALLMTRSRGPLVGAAVGTVTVLAVLFRRKLYALLLVAAIALGVAWMSTAYPGARMSGAGFVGSRSASFRVDVWRQTSALVVEKPLLGHGLGSYSYLGVRYKDDAWDERSSNAHNAWLHIACETGVLGAGTFALFLVLGVAGMLRSVRHAKRLERAVSVGALGAVVVLLAGGVSSVTTDAEPGMLLFSLMALGALRGPAGSPEKGPD